jgi:hypothetical protein
MLQERTQVSEFLTFERHGVPADRGLAAEVLAGHLECERQRKARTAFFHAVAVLSVPLGVQLAVPGLLPHAVERFFLALWVGAALTAATVTSVEWQAHRQQRRRMKALRDACAPERR